MRQGREGRGIDGMDARGNLAEVVGDLLASVGIGRIAQELAGDGDAADPAHDEGLAETVLRPELEQYLRRPHAAVERRAQHAELGGAIERGGTRLLAPAGR